MPVRHRLRAGAAAAVVAALALALLLAGEQVSEEPEPVGSEPVRVPTAIDVAAPSASPAGEDPLRGLTIGPLPSSLRGTEIDGGLRADASGHFVPDPDALALFDYFLAASGEEPDAVIRRRILGQIAATLPPTAAREAAMLLDTYLGFRDALEELVAASAAPSDLERRWQWIRELRRAHFGAETAEALFGREEAILRVDLERRRIAADESLDAAERGARIEAVERSLPESVREGRARRRAPSEATLEARAMRESGATPEEIFAMREARFGYEAAERLAALDRERAAWAERLERYRAERDALFGVPPAIDGPADPELEALRRRHFAEHELVRVRALDAI